MTRMTSYPLAASLSFIAGLAGATASAATFDDTMSELREDLSFGKVSFMARYRYEHVDQVGFRDEANASTVRVALGYETKPFKGLSGFLQYEGVFEVGERLYDPLPGFQGNNRYPLVSDPEGSELNQAYAKYATPAGPTQATFKAGRQEILLYNQRIIGNVGWRQNQQTFDAVTSQLVVVRDTTIGGGYISKVHRITGEDARNTGGTAAAPIVSVNDGTLDMDSWFGFASYRIPDKATLGVYAVGLNYEAPQAKALNSRTVGMRLEGPWKLDSTWSVIYAAEVAQQQDLADYAVGAVSDYEAYYYQLELGVAWQGLGLKAGWSVLQGDGPGDKFTTPLATGHAFNGWAEKFLITPDQGLDTRYLAVGGPLKPLSDRLDGVTAWIVGYRFYSQSGSRHYGDEIDANIEWVVMPLDKNLTLGAKVGGFIDDQMDTITTGAGGVARDTVKTSLYSIYKF